MQIGRTAAIGLMGILLGIGTTGWAQEAPPEAAVEEVVVTATRTEAPLKGTAASVTIITEKEISEKKAKTVLEILRDVPALDVVQTGGLGGTTSVFMRGANSNHTLVLIDGVQVNSPTAGLFDFADLTTENIERIEIVRGPQSTLYGSDAIGGVIHIITKRGKGPAAPFLSLEAGSFGSFREVIGFSGSNELLDYSFSASRFDTRGFSKASERAGNTEKDSYRNTTFSSRVGLSLPREARLEWTARYTDAEVDLDGCDPVTFFCPVDDPNFVQDTRSLVTSLGLTAPMNKVWDQQLKLSFNQDKLKGTDPDTLSNNYVINTQGRRLDWQHNFSLGELDKITVGYEYEAQIGENQGSPGFDEALVNNAGYALNQLRLGSIFLNLGVRYDDNNRFGKEKTYKAEVAYRIEPTGTKIRAAHGTGFHGPTLNDLFFPGFGNPNLKPEKSSSVEAGIEQQLWGKRLRLGVTYFQTRIEDLIQFVSDPVACVAPFAPFNFCPVNVNQAKVIGTELEISVAPVESVTFSANYTFTAAENANTGAELARRPRHKASVVLTLHPLQDLNLQLDVRYIGRRFNDPANTLPLGEYTLVNLAGSYDITPKAQVFARIENLFDREYEEVSGYQTAGISAYGGVKITF